MNAVVDPKQFEDPLWRIHNLYKIIDKKGNVIPFRPNPAQTYFLENMHHRNLILKARQLGFTTLMGIVQLDDCIFTPNTRAAIIAHRMDDAKVIFRDKVKFVYDSLDEGIKSAVRPKQDAADTISFTNNSSFRVSVSTRSGTLQWLHISEYGKICAQFPEKAREIRTGAIPSAEQGIITIESTAEGKEGDFYKKSKEAESLLLRDIEPTRTDFKFFFFPWYMESKYTQPKVSTPVTKEDRIYFEKVQKEIREYNNDPDFVFTEEQINWWVSEEANLGGDMKREYPATPREAFEQAIEGAYFADQIASAEKHGRVGSFPIDPAVEVNTFWDIGRDTTAIWLEQDLNGFATFVDYIEGSEEWIGHYVHQLKDWAREYGVSFGQHFLPHDGDRQLLWLPDGTMDVMSRLGFSPNIVPRVRNKLEAIQVGRRKFYRCRFDETRCDLGLSRLKAYRKTFNEKLGAWSEKPHHGIESHGADAFLTYATSGHEVEEMSGISQSRRYKRKRATRVSFMGV